MRPDFMLLTLLGGLPLSAQEPPPAAAPRPVPAPITDTSPFRRLQLPTPTMIRTGSGAPGRDYWQQRADYIIHASLDTAGKRVTGEETITYTNNSPDTLRYLWMQLDQNLFNNGSRGARLFDPNSRWGTRGADVDVTLTRVAEAGTPAAPGRPARPPGRLAYNVNGTMMRVDLLRPLPPRSRVRLDLAWSFPFGPNSNRMGLEQVDGDYVYEVAQWYPRLAVYDDVRGWNTEQYLGLGEFYLEYGKFDVRLTVPASYLVAATGVLQNPLQVLTATERRRLAQARASDTTIQIRGVAEIDDPATRPRAAGGTLTWHFVADSVRDFAWAAARHFAWSAVGANGGRTLVMSFYPPSADSIWKDASDDGKTAIENYSKQWFPYPYAVASNVNGVEGGMEYPMIVFCRARTNARALYSVTDHEFGHTWFPMVVGSNERLYPWMDEGFNTFINHYNWLKKYGASRDGRGTVASYIPFALSGDEQPIMTPADRTSPRYLGQVAYNKPAVGLVLLRERITTPERFDPVFREYIRRWAFKHPTPGDFFRTMDDGLGEDLSWFWRSWFYTTQTLDQAIDSVTTVTDSGGNVASRLYVENVGPMVMPVEMDLEMNDGSTRRWKLPVEIWYSGPRYRAVVPGPSTVVGVTVDPDSAYPDVNRKNNRWPAGQ